MGRLADVVVSVSARSFGVSCGGVGVLRRVVGKRTALTALVFDAVLAFLAGLWVRSKAAARLTVVHLRESRSGGFWVRDLGASCGGRRPRTVSSSCECR